MVDPSGVRYDLVILAAHACNQEPRTPMQRFEFDILDSTNEEARRLLAAGAIDQSAVITARGQTAGRGTRGRSWASPAGAGLYLSYVCRSREDGLTRGKLPLTTAYTQAAGVACVEALRDVLGVELRIKPVNDLIWDCRKVGGILTEAFVENDRLTALIVGIGINVHRADRRLPVGAIPPVCLAEAVAPAMLPDGIVPTLEAGIVNRLVDCISPARLTAIESDWKRLLMEDPTFH